MSCCSKADGEKPQPQKTKGTGKALTNTVKAAKWIQGPSYFSRYRERFNPTCSSNRRYDG
ncbi:hypothetical protein CS542_04810 [Pedobacter sp. IW39]|nr:hypothetical protein CS542_04810 [Pedobacter sp. IW39]